MIQNIPYELLIEVFSRLSLHDISQTQLVCKDWYKPLYRLLRDLFFIDLHHLRIIQENKPDFLILWANKFSRRTVERPDGTKLKTGIYLAGYDGKSFRTSIKPIETSLELANEDLEFVGSCNGLICMALPHHYQLYFICNPLTGEVYELPKASRSIHSIYEDARKVCDDIYVTHGFAYDAIADTYKITRSRNYYVGVESFSKIGMEIYNVGSGRWRRIKDLGYVLEDITNYHLQFAHPVSFSGALHWGISRQRSLSDRRRILVMNINTEIFKTFEGPPTDQFGTLFLSVLGGCLSSVVCGDENLEMWTMKNYGMENSWEMTFHISRRVEGIYRRRPVGAMNSGSFLFRSEFQNELYHYQDGNLQCIKVLGIPFCFRDVDYHFHVGSLVSPIRILK